jgi:hypothetical protein
MIAVNDVIITGSCAVEFGKNAPTFARNSLSSSRPEEADRILANVCVCVPPTAHGVTPRNRLIQTADRILANVCVCTCYSTRRHAPQQTNTDS